MPYLQLDTHQSFSVETKKILAKRMAVTYSEMMSVDIRRITVSIRELGDGGVWRITEVGSDPIPVSIMMLDIREGRSAEMRMSVAKALCALCIELLGIDENKLNVEFTQHTGDEMYHPSLGGYSPQWQPNETGH